MLPCYQDKASEYLHALFEIKSSVINHTPNEQDSIWQDHFRYIKQHGLTTDNLPSLLALIHPDFYFKGGVALGSQLDRRNNTNFSGNMLSTDRCQAQEYTGSPCVFNTMPFARGKCQADHRWPSSLGGPSILDNRLILCKYHNGMKSNDIAHFNWSRLPNWLDSYLSKLHRLKL